MCLAKTFCYSLDISHNFFLNLQKIFIATNLNFNYIMFIMTWMLSVGRSEFAANQDVGKKKKPNKMMLHGNAIYSRISNFLQTALKHWTRGCEWHMAFG
jgi:hypothetical protein